MTDTAEERLAAAGVQFVARADVDTTKKRGRGRPPNPDKVKKTEKATGDPIQVIKSGVSISWLATSLDRDPRAVAKSLKRARLQPAGQRSNFDVYDIREALVALAGDKPDILGEIHTLDVEDLPFFLRIKYWEMRAERRTFELMAADLYDEDQVNELLSSLQEPISDRLKTLSERAEARSSDDDLKAMAYDAINDIAALISAIAAMSDVTSYYVEDDTPYHDDEAQAVEDQLRSEDDEEEGDDEVDDLPSGPSLENGSLSVSAGVTIKWLAEVFDVSDRTVISKLDGLRPIAKRGREHVYDFAKASRLLVPSKTRLKDVSRTIDAKLFPKELKFGYWKSRNDELAYRISIGQLWEGERVAIALSSILKPLRERLLRLPDLVKKAKRSRKSASDIIDEIDHSVALSIQSAREFDIASEVGVEE
ncbi:hypothetical protein TW83_09920 [Paracoccus sp. S4493]|uniref:hypothetical protein n=1 Tax=Paracoccus sp. S4493 TaxID=579490 RepID=UPI0005FA547A|nr:hypothetical protein [Paracoccus sp. S4493]KJZ31231.1 hypothetical protein TW83_09920 [Paracoccus sp. S4493]